MLTQGKENAFIFKVCYSHNLTLYDALVETTSAQSAVDIIRKQHPDVKIIEVARVVRNWK
jgi:hypothetical protein